MPAEVEVVHECSNSDAVLCRQVAVVREHRRVVASMRYEPHKVLCQLLLQYGAAQHGQYSVQVCTGERHVTPMHCQWYRVRDAPDNAVCPSHCDQRGVCCRCEAYTHEKQQTHCAQSMTDFDEGRTKSKTKGSRRRMARTLLEVILTCSFDHIASKLAIQTIPCKFR